MAISAPSSLASSASTSPSDPISTASISPAANTPGLIFFTHSRNPVTTVSVAAGSGLDLGTISAITNVSYGTIASSARRIYGWWYTGAASPGSGTVDFDFGASANGAAWMVLEMVGMDRSAPIVASATNRADSSTGITVTLDDVGGTLDWDATLGVFANGDSTLSITVGGSFTNIGQLTCASSNSFRMRGEYALSKITAVNCTQSSAHLAGLAVGLKEAEAAASGSGVGLVRGVGLRNRRPAAALG